MAVYAPGAPGVMEREKERKKEFKKEKNDCRK